MNTNYNFRIFRIRFYYVSHQGSSWLHLVSIFSVAPLTDWHVSSITSTFAIGRWLVREPIPAPRVVLITTDVATSSACRDQQYAMGIRATVAMKMMSGNREQDFNVSETENDVGSHNNSCTMESRIVIKEKICVIFR